MLHLVALPGFCGVRQILVFGFQPANIIVWMYLGSGIGVLPFGRFEAVPDFAGNTIKNERKQPCVHLIDRSGDVSGVYSDRFNRIWQLQCALRAVAPTYSAITRRPPRTMCRKRTLRITRRRPRIMPLNRTPLIMPRQQLIRAGRHVVLRARGSHVLLCARGLHHLLRSLRPAYYTPYAAYSPVRNVHTRRTMAAWASVYGTPKVYVPGEPVRNASGQLRRNCGFRGNAFRHFLSRGRPMRGSCPNLVFAQSAI